MTDLTDPERAAFKAFKKKLKSTQLDDDSRLGRSPLTGSGGSKIAAIQTPVGHGRDVWDALVTKGYLRHAGGGLFELGAGQK